MNFPVTPLVGAKPHEKNDAASRFKLGTSFTGNDSKIRIYAKAGGVIAAGTSVVIDPVSFIATAGAGAHIAPAFALVAGDEAWFVKTDAASATYTLPPANLTSLGGVRQAAQQVPTTAPDVAGLVRDFNTLLAALKAAGIMA